MGNEEPTGSFGDDRGAALMPELDPPFDVVEPVSLTCPLIFSSPHSGSVYPRLFLESSRLDPFALRRSEDAFVDELFMEAASVGAPLLRARFPRAFLDLNREPYELDPRMFEGRLPSYANTRSVRVAAGLGTIARVVGESQEIYARPLTIEEGLARIDALYKPYHAALSALVERTHRLFGIAILVDCHSMPSVPAAAIPGSDKKLKTDFVLGDRYGTSCDKGIVDELEQAIRALGYGVQRNKPYAGGFITEHYGAPASGYHTIQIEVNRALYMNEQQIERSERFASVAASLKLIACALAESAAKRGGVLKAAAE
jgi:N-formylglutamate amidohydrolase